MIGVMASSQIKPFKEVVFDNGIEFKGISKWFPVQVLKYAHFLCVQRVEFLGTNGDTCSNLAWTSADPPAG